MTKGNPAWNVFNNDNLLLYILYLADYKVKTSRCLACCASHKRCRRKAGKDLLCSQHNLMFKKTLDLGIFFKSSLRHPSECELKLEDILQMNT